MTEEPHQIDKLEVGKHLRRFLSGAAQNNIQRVRDSWRELITIGLPASPAIIQKLRRGNWKSHKNKYDGRLLIFLVSLLHEISPQIAQSEISRIISGNPHPLHRLTLKVALSRIQDTPAESEFMGIPIVISSDVGNTDHVRQRIESWMQTRTMQDLGGITRIDIIPHEPQFDYLGKYNIMFSGITLAWPKRHKNWLHRWIIGLQAELTFYHEVGHHALGHLEGGQVEEQEREAN